ncbi:sodium-dependent neutral amino acid transporter B(0)AT3 isoform X2 [Macrosteles quadrilineatus]|uniref:sodium-dependent neutral amino acid transporter B(0)AT3 isoform X2 n=1 Tax=Macrosteles quadrilineatus TaxID=74068 RepID=UPI0023E33F2C|nr:sodium-dependent neutral amino acid transporter B(0)AT3 isoform X2 [Macrosteles quadrilineatus]
METKTERWVGHELAPLASGNGGVQIVLTPAEPADAPPRAAWDNKMQFMLSIIGYSVGLGNIWRFPYLCQQNGGGAFLIPFFIMLILEGIPLFLIELGIGQKMRLGSLGVWNTIHPWLGGIGIASCTVTFFVALYYNVIITWCFYYFFNSFQSPLPWSYCPKLPNNTTVPECERSSETAYFWYRTTLDIAPTMDETGGLKWWIVLCLLLAWTMVFFIVMKGIQSSGKVVYFTSMFPYMVLTIFFIRGITLKGAGEGIKHMYTPKVEKLLQPTIWLDAATQVFYSFGLAFGSLIAFGSYNPPKNNCVRDVILVSVCNAFTAIYASIVVFTILGFKAVSNVDRCIESNKMKLEISGLLEKNASLEKYELYISKISNETFHAHNLETCSLSEQLDQAAEGTGLAFIVFTQAIVELPGAPFWAVIFFLMLLSLGIGSQIGILEGMLCTIFDIDLFKRIRKPVLTAFVCGICFIVGLIFCTGAGEYWLKMFDSFAGTIGLVMIALLEMVAVMFIYGHEKFTQDIEDMTGYRPGLYWQVTWRFLAPLIMFCILASSIAFRIIEKPSYHAWNGELGQTEEKPYPGWVLVIAVLMIIASVIPILLVFLLRRFQCLKFDVDIHQGAIRRIDTTVSTKEMMTDVDDEFPEESQDESDDDIGMNCNDQIGKAFKMEVLDF